MGQGTEAVFTLFLGQGPWVAAWKEVRGKTHSAGQAEDEPDRPFQDGLALRIGKPVMPSLEQSNAILSSRHSSGTRPLNSRRPRKAGSRGRLKLQDSTR